MAIELTTDSKGRVHCVVKQTYHNSCGPACVAMVQSAYFGRCVGDPEAQGRQLSRKYWGSFDQMKGTQMMNLVDVLQAERIKCSNVQAAGSSNVMLRIRAHARPATPMILRVVWKSGGAHFIVAAMVDADKMVTFYDPMYGLVQMPGDRLPSYQPKPNVVGSFSGDVIHTYK